MRTLLHRLGHSCHRHGRAVLGLWLALLVLAGAGTFWASGSVDDVVAPRPGHSAAATLAGPGMPATAWFVFSLDPRVDDGATLADPQYRAALGRTLAALREVPFVETVGDPLTGDSPASDTLDDQGAAGGRGLAGDGRTAYALVAFSVTSPELAAGTLDDLIAAARPARDAGITADVTGPAAEQWSQPRSAVRTGLLLGAFLVAVVAAVAGAGALTSRVGSGSTPVRAALADAGPVLPAGLVSVAIGGFATREAAGHAGFDVTAAAPALAVGLATALGFAVFVTARFRQETAAGHPGPEAAGRTLRTAGAEVAVAGLIMMITPATLAVTRVPMLTMLGLATAGCVALSVCAALTLPVAALGAVRAGGRYRTRFPSPRGTRRPARALLLGLAVLGALAVPVADLRLGILDHSATAATDSTVRRAQDQLSAVFGPGFTAPLLLVADTADAPDPQGAVRQIRDTVTTMRDVALATEPHLGDDLATITVIPLTGAGDPATAELVHDLRERATGLEATTGVRLTVGGRTALDVDVAQRLTDMLPLCLVLSLGLTVAVLVLALRGLAAAAAVALGSLGGLVGTSGAAVAVLQWGWLAGPLGIRPQATVAAVLPVVAVGLLVGLTAGNGFLAVTVGFRDSARATGAVTAVAVVVLAGLAVPADPLLRPLGLVLAFGLLLDVLVVRLVLVPSALRLLGRSAWWLPTVSVRRARGGASPPTSTPAEFDGDTGAQVQVQVPVGTETETETETEVEVETAAADASGGRAASDGPAGELVHH